MPSTNGHSPKRAILYARVSTDEQARSGYSLAQQFEALRQYAEREGYEILEELKDPGQSGASLDRPGMDRVRDLVSAGDISVVLAQDRDRFAREPAYLYLLKLEFEEYGTKLTALNDRGDDSPEGELMDGIFDQFAKFERAKTAIRTQRGRLRRAREGKIIPGGISNYGFRLNAARDNYQVDEEAMQVVRRIFELVGVQGSSIHGVARTLEREGLTTPTGGQFWDVRVIRRFIFCDVYKLHSFAEISELIDPELAARLDPEKRYGIWWFNRRRINKTQVAGTGPNGRFYRKQSKLTVKPKDEWIAVPVPDSGIPREVVESAREAIRENRPTSASGERFWELSGGVLYCSGCGRKMTAHITPSSQKARVKVRYCYYRWVPKGSEPRQRCLSAK